MKTNNDRIQKILNQPSYWVESINGYLYDAILSYMETNNLNRTELSQHLGISKGRVSQILNDGEINFSIEKLIEISLKIGKYPVFEFKDAETYATEAGQSKKPEKTSIRRTKAYRAVKSKQVNVVNEKGENYGR